MWTGEGLVNVGRSKLLVATPPPFLALSVVGLTAPIVVAPTMHTAAPDFRRLAGSWSHSYGLDHKHMKHH